MYTNEQLRTLEWDQPMAEEFAAMVNRVLPPKYVAKAASDGRGRWGVDTYLTETGEMADPREDEEYARIMTAVIAETGMRTGYNEVIQRRELTT